MNVASSIAAMLSGRASAVDTPAAESAAATTEVEKPSVDEAAPTETKVAEVKEEVPAGEELEEPADEVTEGEPVEGEGSSEEDVVADLTARNMQLQKQLEEVLATQGTQPAADATADETIAVDLAPLFADTEKVNAAMQDPEAFRDFMIGVANATANRAAQGVNARVPEIVNHLVSQRIAQYMQAEEFFKVNKDLRPHRKFVGYTFSQLAAEEPAATAEQIMNKLADESRKRLGLNKVKQTPPAQRGGTPANPGVSGTRITPPTKPAGVASEISKMMKI